MVLTFPLPLVAQVPDAQPPFVETIEVREVELRVDLSSLPTLESIGRRGAEDFIVVEDGISYPLTELAPAAVSDWIFVLYFDPILAGPAARQRAAIELAGQADRLVSGGLTEIVIADPLPRTVLATGDAEALRRRLDELALAAASEADPVVPSPAPAGEAATTTRLTQLDRLTVELAARGGGGARGLILPVGSWPLDPQELAGLSNTKTAPSAETPKFAPLHETARALAGYGWVTLPLALRAESAEPEPSAAEKRTQVAMGGSGDRRTTVPILSLSGADPVADPATAAQIATVTDLSLMPFAELARATSGALVGERGRLESALSDLLRRRQFTYRSPFPQPGRLLSLEVRWSGGDGRLLRAPRWLRSSSPPEVSAVRLRRLLSGDIAPQAPAASAIQWSSADGRVCFPGDGDHRWVRLSTATDKGGQIHTTTGAPLQAQRSAAGLCVETPPAVAGSRTARLAEDLETEAWSGVVIGAD